MTTKLLHTNDWHFAVKNPSSRTDDYNEELFASLENMYRLVQVLKISAICIAGDLFHDKDRAPWRTAARMLEWGRRIRQINCELLVIPGNHDEKHDRYDSIDRTPISVLFESGLFTNISFRSVLVGGNEGTQGRPGAIWVYGIPWPDGGTPAPFAGIPEFQADVVLAHGWATPDGAERYGHYCHRYDDLGRLAPRVRVWHFGHDHSDNGVYQLKNEAKVINIGALSRGALDTDNLTRTVKVAISDWPLEWRSGGPPITVQQVALPVPPIDQIFDLQKRQQRAREQLALQAFVEQFKASLGTGLISVRYEDVLARTSLDAAVRTKVQAYLQRAEEQ